MVLDNIAPNYTMSFGGSFKDHESFLCIEELILHCISFLSLFLFFSINKHTVNKLKIIKKII